MAVFEMWLKHSANVAFYLKFPHLLFSPVKKLLSQSAG